VPVAKIVCSNCVGKCGTKSEKRKKNERRRQEQRQQQRQHFWHFGILVSFVVYIYIPEDTIRIAKVVGYLVYVTFFPGVFFAHATNQVLVYIFYSQFKKLKKNFRRALGTRGEFTGEFPLFRRRHQMLSRAISKLDGFMKLSNVAGFVFHILSIILLIYSFIFYPKFTSSLTYVFWTAVNVHGLLFSASAGIIVNHMVRTCVRCNAHIC